MIKRKSKAVDRDGKVTTVTGLTPETHADVLEIRRLARAGLLDDREQLNDRPYHRRRRRRRRGAV